MPDYLFSYRGDPADSDGQTAAEAREGQARFDTWVAGLGEAVIVPGTPVRDCQRVGGRRGSAAERPDCVLGYSIVRAVDMDAALKLARACPHLEWGDIEVAETTVRCSLRASSEMA